MPKERRDVSSRLHPILLMPLLLGLPIAAYAGYWFLTAQVMENGLQSWIDQRRAEGFEISHGTVTIQGFPIEVAVTVPEPVVVAPPEQGGWEWRGDGITATVTPWAASEISVTTHGVHHVTPPIDQGLSPLSLQEGTLIADLTLDLMTGEVGDTRVSFDNAVVQGLTPLGPVKLEALTISHMVGQTQGAGPESTSLSLAVEGTNLTLPPGLTPSLAPTISSLSLTADVMSSFGPGPLSDSLALWRDAGGLINITNLDVDWKPLRLKTKGTLTLDQDMQPIGSFNATIQGFLEAIDGLARTQLVTRTNATLAKVVLNTLARRSLDGGSAVLYIPVSVTKSKVFLANVPLVVLPPLTWGAKEPLSAPPTSATPLAINPGLTLTPADPAAPAAGEE